METLTEPEKPGCLDVKTILVRITGSIMSRVDNWMIRELDKEWEDFIEDPYK